MAIFIASLSAPASAQDPMPSGAPPFVTSSEQQFPVLMRRAMRIMDEGMSRAHTGDTDADFVGMMVPHHQGAIDMARALLVYSKDPELRAMAQHIITEQQNEIRQMQAWLVRHRVRGTMLPGGRP